MYVDRSVKMFIHYKRTRKRTDLQDVAIRSDVQQAAVLLLQQKLIDNRKVLHFLKARSATRF